MYRITVLNEKGGVAKTTSVYNVAYSLALQGKKVLMIDFDSQASLTVAVGLELSEMERGNLGNVLMQELNIQDVILSIDCRENTNDKALNIDIVPSHNSLGIVLQQNFDAPALTKRMDSILQEISEEYDYVLIDCPPTISSLLVASLMLSDGILLPTLSGDYLSLTSVENTLNDLVGIQANRDGLPEVLGVIVTRFKKGIKNHTSMLQHLKETYRVLAIVNETDAFLSAVGDGVPVKLLRPATMQSRNAAREYIKVAEFIVNHCEYRDNGRKNNFAAGVQVVKK